MATVPNHAATSHPPVLIVHAHPVHPSVASRRVRIGVFTAAALSSVAVLLIILLVVLRRRERRRKMQAGLPMVVLTSPSSPHVWIVPPIPRYEPDPQHLVPPKSPAERASRASWPSGRAKRAIEPLAVKS